MWTRLEREMTNLFPLQISIVTRCNSLVKAQPDIGNCEPTGWRKSKRTIGSAVLQALLSIHGACLRAQSCSKKKYHGRELSELLGLDDFDDFAYDT